MNDPREKNGPSEVKSGAATGTKMADPARYCPNCSMKLYDRGCKLKCPQCGYYLSCSDFY